MGGGGYDYGNGIAIDAGYVYATGSFGNTADFNPALGTFNLTSAGAADAFVIKLTQSPPFIIQGNVFGDANTNCNNDTADIPLPDFILKAEPGPSFGYTDSAGHYAIYLFDTGAYTISLATEDTIRQSSCNTSYTYNFQVPLTPPAKSILPCKLLSIARDYQLNWARHY